MRAIAVLSLAALLLGTSVRAADDPKVVRVCKVLETVVAKAKVEKPDPDTMQMWVVFGLAEEFGDDMTYLGEFAGKADELTQPVCPDARDAVIEITGKSSLSSVVR
ncbi:hypothetical protein sos41_27640 [Alphaproteobacteria bacterium SO-S41]|nr:hypothetical protein sos41_27640 [Alphaproteobacteria bacterium SO-S41]